jgi:ribosomal protein S25
MPREQSDTGGFVETVHLDDVMDVFEQVEGPPVITSSDVADALDCTPDTARRKFADLQEEGRIKRRDPSSRVSVWYPASTTESDGDDSERDENALTEDDPDAVLKCLSSELGEAIAVGDTVYENGDKHAAGDS